MAQDNSSSDQQQQYKTQRKHREKVESDSVDGDSWKTRRLSDDLSSSASASSRMPVPLSTCPPVVDGLPYHSNTDNDHGHVGSESTFSMGRTEHGIEQVCAKFQIWSWLNFRYEPQTHVGSGGPAERIPKARQSAESSSSEKESDQDRIWNMVKEIRATTKNFQYIMGHLNEWLEELGANAITIQELCEEWNTLQTVCDS